MPPASSTKMSRSLRPASPAASVVKRSFEIDPRGFEVSRTATPTTSIVAVAASSNASLRERSFSSSTRALPTKPAPITPTRITGEVID